MRLLSLIAFGFLAGLIVLIYNMKFETRQLEERAALIERAIAEEKDNVALMRAEWSHVSRPERIESLARDILKLDAAKPGQLLAQRDFLEVLARRPAPQLDAKGWKPQDEIGALIRSTGPGAR
jgi:cell division protein FtsL